MFKRWLVLSVALMGLACAEPSGRPTDGTPSKSDQGFRQTAAEFTPEVQTFVLVTPDEVARERAKGDPPRSLRFRSLGHGKAGVPEIVLVSPASLTNISSPFNIELKFLPKWPSKIVRDSLLVLYGFFALNVTDRLTKHAEVTSSGILVKGAELPPGSSDGVSADKAMATLRAIVGDWRRKNPRVFMEPPRTARHQDGWNNA